MSDRSRSGSAEGAGDDIRPYGEEHDSSEESEDDPEEAKRIAEGFIVDNDDDEEEDEDEEEKKPLTKEERRQKRREAKRRKREQREARKKELLELSDDELDLLQENQGGPSHRPAKRAKRDGEDVDDDAGRGVPGLQDIFADDEGRMGEDDDDDDLGDFIEESEDEEGGGETEEQRRERKRQEKLKRREAKKAKPDAAGVDKVAWDEIHEVFGDGTDFDWALDAQVDGGDAELDDEVKKNLRLEDVFDPAEIKERRLQDEDRVIAQRDRPERHQLVNSTLSDNPVIAPDTIFPDPELAAGFAYNRISLRTQYLFCSMHEDHDYPVATYESPDPPRVQRRYDLAGAFHTAVSRALSMMFVHHLEVPYLWHYKRDAFSVLEESGRSSVQFLDRDELWKLFELGIRFRAIYERNNHTTAIWDKIKTRKSSPELSVAEKYLEDKLLRSICMMSIEAAAEGGDWLEYHYRDEIRRIKEQETAEDGVVKKLPAKAAQDDVRSGPILKLVEAFGIVVSQVAVAFNDLEGKPVAPTNCDKRPFELAEEFSGNGTPFTDAEVALKAASQILATEFFKDPSIRQQARDFMEACALVSVEATDKGLTVIDEYHLYSTFKFLTDKPALAFKESPQFLHMLQAEEEGLIKIEIKVPELHVDSFAATLVRCCQSDEYGEISKEWNAQREAVISDVVRGKLLPMGQKWLKEHLRGEAEDYVAERCRMELEFRVNVRPYQGKGMESGETPSVLAITTGRGDVRDAVIAIILDQEGNIRSQNKFDNLKDELNKAAFFELLDKRSPQVVAIGGMSVHTSKLKEDATVALRDYAIQRFGENPPVSAAFDDPEHYAHELAHFDDRLRPHMIPMIFPSDATARLYMTSEEAEKEHPTLPANGRYALGLARYTQNPLNSYCKVARSIASVTFVEHHQKLISNEKLLLHLERGLVNAVCSTGIEINSCVADPYERVMIPFIAGLGPRKADVLINTVLKQGSFVNRLGFSEIFGPTVFENVAGFLTIETDISGLMLDEQNPQDQPDPLDKTRIHPEDYEFAQKMCQDALDQDAEDVADQHKSDVVLQLMVDSQRHLKLGELNLDDFAFNLQKQGEGNKRHVLGEIVGELISWRADRRPQFYVPTDWEVVQMLTGETERTIGRGLRVTATVRRALASRAFCQLESGMDAILEREYIQDEDPWSQAPELRSCEDVLKPRQAVKAVVIAAEPARFQVRISTRQSDLDQAIPFVQPFRDEPYNSAVKRLEAEDRMASKQRKAHGSTKRKVDHPNFHDMNSGQAEQFLASMQKGDVVIRRSSKGPNHLAITWKVDEDVFQHIDVEEIDKPNEYAVGRLLRVGKYSYMDLDDLIINHVKAMARKFEEMIVHEKYRPEQDMDGYLKNYVQAHPGRSMYGFSIDSGRPGYLKLSFLNKSTKDGGVVQTWPVKVLPGAYRLNNAEVPGVMELCNAFKAQYSNKLLDQGTGGKTPGIRAGKTPMGGRTPGGRTPAVGMGRGGATPMAMYGGRTPMPGQTPYGQAPMTAYGGNATPYGAGYPGQGGPSGPSAGGYGGQQQGYPPPPQAGYGMPPPPNGGQGYGMPPPRPTGGINPERAAMLARQQGGARY